VVQQKLLPFDGGGQDRGGERNSPERSLVQQARPASKDAEATDSPLLKAVVREETLARAWKAVRANRGGPGIMLELTQYLRGWLGYYRLIETPSVLTKLQSWIHRKLRCYRIKQLGRASRLYWELKRLGIPARDLGWLVTTSRGPWRLSRNPQVHSGFSARFFAALGLFQLPPAWRTFASTR